MQQQNPVSFSKSILPLFFLFVLVNSLLIFFRKLMYTHQIDVWVIFAANCILFVISILSLALHLQASHKKTPLASVGNVMLVTLMKLLVLGGAAILYLVLAGPNRSVYAVFVGMVLYLVYTFLEVSIAAKINGNNK
ncbi:MAG: hypothetical protein EKK39_12165 [Sphingobacteriales bacterium]|uniref:hypothetical protein n=1 Tax=Hydrotalea flava TaxID=714549 RepID=UPI000831D3D3|nr:hypothetical protein [Hydrotalea flava]RTL48655.1 MAG: hypothetical protein EKK39_12165 [Sphingobacteriales bacterium]